MPLKFLNYCYKWRSRLLYSYWLFLPFPYHLAFSPPLFNLFAVTNFLQCWALPFINRIIVLLIKSEEKKNLPWGNKFYFSYFTTFVMFPNRKSVCLFCTLVTWACRILNTSDWKNCLHWVFNNLRLFLPREWK